MFERTLHTTAAVLSDQGGLNGGEFGIGQCPGCMEGGEALELAEQVLRRRCGNRGCNGGSLGNGQELCLLCGSLLLRGSLGVHSIAGSRGSPCNDGRSCGRTQK